MINLLKTNIGRLRILAFFEGLSLIILVFVAVPMKHFYDNPSLVKSLGPIHGVLFLVFVGLAVMASFEYNWKFWRTFKVLISSFIPFGTFYIDRSILSKL